MSLSSRKQLAALQAKSAHWAARSAELAADPLEPAKPTPAAGEGEAEERDRKRQKREDVRAAVAAAAAGSDDDDDDDAMVISDATASEQAALAAMFPKSFGAAPKQSNVAAAQHAKHARKEVPAGDAKVKVEGAAPVAAAPAPASTAQPKKVAAPAIAPAALLGGAYDSSDDDDDDDAGNSKGAAGAAAASSNTAAASSTAAAAMSTDDDDDSDDDGDDPSQHPLLRTLPISHEAELRTNGHTKTVSALCLDRAGGRVLSGGYDYQAKQWDFGGMNETLAAFRTFEPQEGHQVRQLCYSTTGDMFLAVTGSAQPKIYTREALEVCQFARGDMYIQDQKTTKGHSTPVTSGWWHPTDRNLVMTSGIDGTVRLWDVNDVTKNLAVLKPRGTIRGTAVSATAFSRDGKLLASACTDGSLRLLKAAKPRDFRDSLVVQEAHAKGSETSACLFASDDWSLYTRGGPGDDSLKHWDVRAFRQPVQAMQGLPNAYPETDLALGPNEKVLVTGTSERVGGRVSGSAVFLERATFKPLQRVSMGTAGAGVVRSVWHPSLNQVLFGCADGVIRLLYSPDLSSKGVLLCLSRRAKPKPLTDYTSSVGQIVNPHALPSLREGGSRKRAREKAAAALAPEAPVQGKVGVGGRAAGAQSITAFQLSKYVSQREDPRAKDPREALLAMDELAKKDPMFFGRAYRNTQPVTILADVPDDEKQVQLTEEEQALANKREGEIK